MLVSELCENGDLFDYIVGLNCPYRQQLQLTGISVMSIALLSSEW